MNAGPYRRAARPAPVDPGGGPSMGFVAFIALVVALVLFLLRGAATRDDAGARHAPLETAPPR